MRLLAGAGAMTASLATAHAQGTCRPPDDSNEAQVFGIQSVPLAYSGLGGGAVDRPGRVWAVLELSYLPSIDSVTRTPTICRPGKPAENTNPIDVFPRPRVGLVLPYHFSLEASWIPPVRVNGVRANLFGVSLAWTHAAGRTVSVAFRAHGTFGEIRAPVTCDDDALGDPASECFGGTKSDDRYRPNIFGVDATVALALGSGRWRPYVGGGYNRLEPRFQVHFVNSAGQLDDTRVEVGLNRGTVFGGLQWLPNGWLVVGGEAYAAPADAVTGRAFLRAYLN